MENRLRDYLKNATKKIFVGFIPLNFKSEDFMINSILEMQKNGIDIIEIGFGGENPYMDGKIIREAYLQGEKSNVQLENLFSVVKKLRLYTEIPIVFMTYKNEILKWENKCIYKRLKDCGIDALLVPDYEYEKLKENAMQADLINIKIVKSQELHSINNSIDGFIYCISNRGKTGRGFINFDKLFYDLNNTNNNLKNKILVGFGMGDIENIKKVKEKFEGVIIGSSIVEILERYGYDSKEFKDYILKCRFELDIS
ncbi:MAG: tryptophan synthase subunit alpha [Sarcina sp.]